MSRIWFTKVHTIIRTKYLMFDDFKLNYLGTLYHVWTLHTHIVVAWQRIRAILLSLTSDIWTGLYFGWALLKCIFRFEVYLSVRPSVESCRRSITFPVIQAWRVERARLGPNDFYKLLLPFVMQRSKYVCLWICKYVCMQKARTYFATIAKNNMYANNGL